MFKQVGEPVDQTRPDDAPEDWVPPEPIAPRVWSEFKDLGLLVSDLEKTLSFLTQYAETTVVGPETTPNDPQGLNGSAEPAPPMPLDAKTEQQLKS